ncbi:MAG: hypothetical protein WCG87_10895 [Bacteroidota bacterium]
MKQLLSLIIALIITTGSYAQPEHRHDDKAFEKVRSVHIALLTRHMNLTPKQAEQFWPIYNEFDNERTIIRKKYKKYFPKNNAGEYNNPDKETRPDANTMLDKKLDRQQEMLDLKRKYKEQFLKVVSPEQLVQMDAADNDFTMMLLQQRAKNKRRNNNNNY